MEPILALVCILTLLLVRDALRGIRSGAGVERDRP
jgi:hypothetical protein